jgi:hypothetical protein
VEFASIRDADRLTWQRVSLFAGLHQVDSSAGIVGTIKLSFAAWSAEAACAEGNWKFSRRGFFGTTIGITDPRDNTEVGTLRFRGWNATLTLASGKLYKWKLIGFWSGERGFFTSSEFPVVTFRPKHFSFRLKGEIGVRREYASLPEVPLLVMLGAYAAIISQRGRRS